MSLNLLKTSLLMGLLPSLLLAQESRNTPVQGKIPFLSETKRSETAASVFIDFARKHYGNRFAERMKLKGDSPPWPGRIAANTKMWTAWEAKQFLESLVEKIGVQETLKKLKRPSYLKVMSGYRTFQKTTEILYAWAGEEAAANKLIKSLSGTERRINETVALALINFFRTTKTAPEDMLSNLKKDLRHYKVKEEVQLFSLFKNIVDKRGRLEGLDPQATMTRLWERFFSLDMQYSVELVSRLEDYLDFMDDYLRAWKIVKDMMLRNTADFSRIELRPFRRVLRFLRGRPIEENNIKNLVSNNIKGIAHARSGRLRTNARKLEALFTSQGEEAPHEIVNQMMLGNFFDFYSMDFEELGKVRLFMMRERGISEERVDLTFSQNVDGIEAAKEKRLKTITEHLDAFFADAGLENPKSYTNEMMLGNIGSFSRINLWEFDQVVLFLKNRGIPKKQIAEVMAKSAEGASLARKERLTFVATYMQVFFGGGDEAKDIADEMMLRNLARFTNIDTQELDELQEFLKKREVAKEKMQTAFRKNVESISKIKTRNFKRGVEHLDALFIDEKNAAEIVNEIALNDLASVSQIVPEEFDKTLDFFRRRSFPETLIRELVKEDIKGVASFRIDQSRPVIKHLDAFFGAEIVSQMMLNDFDSFILIKIEPFDALVAALKARKIPDDKIIKALAGNVQSLAYVKTDGLISKALSMQTFFVNLGFSAEDAKVMVDAMMIKSIIGFYLADIEELGSLAVSLKNLNVPNDKIAKIFTKSITNIVETKNERLEPVARHLRAFFEEFTDKEEAHKIVNEMIFQNLADFSAIDTEEFDKVVGVLKKRGIGNARIGGWVRKNIRNLALLNHEQLEEGTLRMEVFFERLITEAMLEDTAGLAQVTNEQLIDKSTECRALVTQLISGE